MSEKRFFKLVNHEILFGESEVDENGEICIKEPLTIKSKEMMRYMDDIIGESPKAVYIHPMNILWNCKLSEFPELEKAVTKATSGIIY